MSLNLRKKLFLIFITTAGISLTACSGEQKHESIYSSTLTKLCLESNDESNIDEVMSMGDKVIVGIPNSKQTTEESLIESLDKLETYTKRLIMLKEAGFTGELKKEFNWADLFVEEELEPQEISDERKEQLISLTEEELSELIKKYNKNSQKDVERARTEQELNFLFKNDQNWLQENSAFLLESAMMRILKASVCYASGLEPEKYKDCTILADNGRNKHRIIVKDSQTGKEFLYKITEDSGVYYEVLEILYGVQSGYIASTETIAEGLNVMKECTVSPVAINDEGVLVPTITKEDAIQKVKSYN